MSSWWVKVNRPFLRRALYRKQRFVEIDVAGFERVRGALNQDAGILITPNHSFHYDSYVLIEAAHRIGRPFHFLTAWQVFAISSRFEQWSLQRHGCFSIDRESADRQAFRQSVDILRESPYPLVVFPEGDIYHTNDRVTPFHEGAAAIALAGARRAERPIVAVPCALKCWYVEDPTAELLDVMSCVEQRLYWRPRPDLPLAERIYRVAEGLLALKELEYLGGTRRGSVRERILALAETILGRMESRHEIRAPADTVPTRVKELRQRIIADLRPDDLAAEVQKQLAHDVDDLFFVMQLFSYPGDYVAEKPSVERIAETLDNFEEDVLELDYPGVRGRRRVAVRFGEPVEIPRQRTRRDAASQITGVLQRSVQMMLDEMNASHAEGGNAPPDPARERAWR